MKSKWILRCNLTDLRAKHGLSMEALAKLAYTTNTTIFRIEKTGFIADYTLAERLASIFDVPFVSFCSVDFVSDKISSEWEKQIEKPYLTQPDTESDYYVVFVRRYEKFSEYSAVSPTSWAGFENGRECRKLLAFKSEGIIEHLAECGVRCAVVNDSLSLIDFYYSIPNNNECAALIKTDVADSIYHNLVKEYVCDVKKLFSRYGFNDLVEIELRGVSLMTAKTKEIGYNG